ncbi:MAG: AAA family ATPase, partial [Clostridia bacterium]|nr:AAA family ATPase [Clostridia bacterium]
DDKKATIKSARQKEEIIAYLTDHISARSADIAALLGVKSTRAKKLLSELTAEEIVVAEGGNRNRTYKLKSK